VFQCFTSTYSGQICHSRSLKRIQGHAIRDIGVLYHFRELLKRNLSIAVLIGFHDCLVDNLQVSRRNPHMAGLPVAIVGL
jgi:hypothetical protein